MSKFFFEDPSNVAGEYEKLMTRIKNAKMQASTKLNALEKYVINWNRKNEDDLDPLQKNLVYLKVQGDIGIANSIAVSLEGYYSQVMTLAEKMDETGHDEVKLREEFAKLADDCLLYTSPSPRD